MGLFNNTKKCTHCNGTGKWAKEWQCSECNFWNSSAKVDWKICDNCRTEFHGTDVLDFPKRNFTGTCPYCYGKGKL